MLVQEAVVGDLVPAGEDRLDGGWILLDAPGRDEEGLAMPSAAKLSTMRGTASGP